MTRLKHYISKANLQFETIKQKRSNCYYLKGYGRRFRILESDDKTALIIQVGERNSTFDRWANSFISEVTVPVYMLNEDTFKAIINQLLHECEKAEGK